MFIQNLKHLGWQRIRTHFHELNDFSQISANPLGNFNIQFLYVSASNEHLLKKISQNCVCPNNFVRPVFCQRPYTIFQVNTFQNLLSRVTCSNDRIRQRREICCIRFKTVMRFQFRQSLTPSRISDRSCL